VSGPDPLNLPRGWIAVPVALCVLLLGARACLHDDPLDRLAATTSAPGDPPGASARAGSIWIARGGPVIVGFQSAGPARLQIGGRDLRGQGLVHDRLLLRRGAETVRFAAPRGARLVWSPVGRRGDPEYVPANSLSPDPSAHATFTNPGAAPLDGAIALAILVVIVATLLVLARRRLRSVSRQTWIAIGGVLVLALATRLIGLGAMGQTWDEDVYWAAGKNYVTNLLALDFSHASWIWNYEHPPVTKYLDGIGALLADGYGPARALSAIWSALGCALLVPIGRRLFSARAGVLAGVIAALLPPLVAHGQIVGHESPTVLWWSLAILLSLTVHDDLDAKASTRRLIVRLAWIGAVIGLATATRFVNGLLGPVCAAIVVIEAPPAWRNRTIAWGAAVMPVIAIATVYAVWPRLWLHPIANLEDAFAKLSTLHAPEPYLGTLTRQPADSYFLIYLMATAPLGVLLGVAGYAARVVAGTVRVIASYQLAPLRAHAIVLAWFAIPLVGIVLSPVRQDGVRYVMPCVLALAVMAAAGFDALADLIRPRAFVAIAALVAGYLALTLIRTAPYYLDYFDEATGGAGRVADRKTFEVAWWGEGLDRAVAYVNANAEPYAVVYRDCIEPAHLAWFREDLWERMTPDPRRARWLVVYAPAARGCSLPPDARQVYQVTHDGAELVRVYRRP